MSDYPKYQYSYFLDNGAQVVVRGEDKVEWYDDVESAMKLFPTKQENVTSRSTTAPQKPIVRKDYCNIHNKDMKERISKAGKPYNAHYKKVGQEWDTCFGKGWLSEQEGQSSEEIGANL